MDETPTTPIHIDARIILETIQAGLAFLLAGVAAIGLTDHNQIIASLAVGAVIVMINRLLGKSATDAVSELKAILTKVVTANTVLQADATAATLRKVEDAVQALDPPKV